MPTVIIEDNFVEHSSAGFSSEKLVNFFTSQLIQTNGIGDWFTIVGKFVKL